MSVVFVLDIYILTPEQQILSSISSAEASSYLQSGYANRKKNATFKSMISSNHTWYIIPCPSTVLLTGVCKERGTHGSIYCLWECEGKLPVWIGQSIPALVRSINDKAVLSDSKRLHASSLYRCLRKEARKESHKSWKVEKFSRTQVEDLNNFVKNFSSVVFVSKSPELWKCSRPEQTIEISNDAEADQHLSPHPLTQ